MDPRTRLDTSPRPDKAELERDPFTEAQDDGRVLGQRTNAARPTAIHAIWGEQLDCQKRESRLEKQHLTPDAAGCKLYLWWGHEGNSAAFTNLPGKKKSYSPFTMIEFAREWAKDSPVWTLP